VQHTVTIREKNLSSVKNLRKMAKHWGPFNNYHLKKPWPNALCWTCVYMKNTSKKVKNYIE